MKTAVIGIGSNSVRMLMAEVHPAGFTRLGRDRAGTRLFSGLDEQKNLSAESMKKTALAVCSMAEKARVNGCGEIRIFATSASRDARNGDDFIAMIREMTGVTPDIISGTEEARLSYLGASQVLNVTNRGVIDIGGGSTEIVTGTKEGPKFAFSCQMGAVRLYNTIRLDSREDLPAIIAGAKAVLAETEQTQEGFTVPEDIEWVGTGGTFTTLAAIARGVPWTDRTNIHGMVISRETVSEIAGKLADMTLEQRKELPGLQPGRADIVVHGIGILLGIMDRYQMMHLTVSEFGNLDGYILSFLTEKQASEA